MSKDDENTQNENVTPPIPEADVRKLVESYEKQKSFDGELRREITLLYTLLDAVKGLNEIGDFTALISYIVDRAIETVSAEKGFIVVFDVLGSRITVARDSNRSDFDIEKDGISKSVVAQVVESGRRLILDDSDVSTSDRMSVFELALRSIACFPLKLDDEILGVLYLHSRKGRKFGAMELRALSALAEITVAAIHKAVLFNRQEIAHREIERLNNKLSSQLREREDELTRTREALARQSEVLRAQQSYGGMIGVSDRHRRIIELLKTLEKTDLPVLLQGESGTGKELTARAIHAFSGRSEGAFLAINCGAIPDGLLSAELFGHKRGAFTGATQERRGLFEIADKGTLFLDEVVSMSPEMQKSLLRVLERGEVFPLGSEKAIHVDVRVIAAANRDVKKLTSDGTFREDLFYRLAVVTIELPRLADRREDIPMLVEHFVEKYTNPNDVTFPPAVMAVFQRFDWPGNVRQLENEIRRALALGSGSLSVEFFAHLELKPDDKSGTSGPSLKLEELEEWAIRKALEAADGQKLKAAEILGIPRRTLYEKLKRLGM